MYFEEAGTGIPLLLQHTAGSHGVQWRHLFDLRFQKERGEVKDNRQFARTKKDIARLMQHMGELNVAAELGAEGALLDETASEE